MTTLIYHTGALGDFITSLPALSLWRLQHPGHHVVLLGKPRFGLLAQDSGYIDETRDIDNPIQSKLFNDNLTDNTLHDLLGGFQSALLFCNEDSPLLKNCRRIIPNVIQHSPFPKNRMHIIDYHLSLFDASIIANSPHYPIIKPSPAALLQASDILRNSDSVIALHPGSGSRSKNWPIENFLEIAGDFRNKGYTIAWDTGPADEINFSLPGEDLHLNNVPVSTLAGVLSQCRLYIGNDSGVTHLAAAVDCPTIALFGPSDSHVWAPRGNTVRIIDLHHFCAPCHPNTTTTSTCLRKCLSEITPQHVFTESMELLKPKATRVD